jgi:hypothetical protein
MEMLVPPVTDCTPVEVVRQVAQEIFGAVPPELTIGPEAVTAVTVPEPTPQAPTIVINRPPVVAWTQFPEERAVSATLAPVIVPLKVGEFDIEMFGVVPPDEAKFPEAVTAVTPPDAQGPAVVVRSPLTPACTQSPEVSPVPVRDSPWIAPAVTSPPAVSVPENVGALTRVIFGVVPPEESTLPEPVTAVTVPEPVPQAAAVVVNSPPAPACTQSPGVRVALERPFSKT